MHPRSEGVSGFDAFFEIHPLSQFHPNEVTDYLPWLKDLKKPVYVFHDLGVESQVLYPKQRLEEQHGSAFLTSTIAWMLALAIDQSPAEIGIWGVDMANDTEYAHQKTGCLHFIALARLANINVVLPSGSELLNVPAVYPDRYATKTALTLTKKIDAANADGGQQGSLIRQRRQR